MEFVYAPRNGAYLFAEKNHPVIGVVVWSNGCSHIVGGVRLDFYTASPGKWWRGTARRAAEEIVAAVGGQAWDVRGHVSLIVPRQHAWEVLRVMELVGGLDLAAEDRERNRTHLYRVGMGRIKYGYGFEFCPAPDPYPEEPLKATVSEDGVVTFSDSRGSVYVRWKGRRPGSVYPEPTPEPEAKTEATPTAEAEAKTEPEPEGQESAEADAQSDQ